MTLQKRGIADCFRANIKSIILIIRKFFDITVVRKVKNVVKFFRERVIDYVLFSRAVGFRLIGIGNNIARVVLYRFCASPTFYHRPQSR